MKREDFKGELRETGNLTRKDKINMGSCSKSLQDVTGQVMAVKSIAIMEDVDKEGQQIVKACFTTTEGDTVGTVSATAIRTLEPCIDLINDGEEVKLLASMQKSKNGRDFIALSLV